MQYFGLWFDYLFLVWFHKVLRKDANYRDSQFGHFAEEAKGNREDIQDKFVKKEAKKPLNYT